MGKGIVGVLILLIIIVIAGYFVINMSSENKSLKTKNLNDDSMIENDGLNSGDSMMDDGTIEEVPMKEVRAFVLTGQNFKFMKDGVANPVLMVKEGDKVRIEFSSTSGFHDWSLDEFNAATSQVSDNDGMTFVEFTADKKGTFEYYCSVGQHRANGMKGMFIVE